MYKRIARAMPHIKSGAKMLLYSSALIAAVALPSILYLRSSGASDTPAYKVPPITYKIILPQAPAPQYDKPDFSTLESIVTESGELCSERIDSRMADIEKFEGSVDSFASAHGLEEYLALYKSLVYAESGVDHTVVSAKGATGAPQLMPATFDDLPRVVEILKKRRLLPKDYGFTGSFEEYKADIEMQAVAGFLVFVENMVRSNGDARRALAEYNAGAKNVADAIAAAEADGITDPSTFASYSKFLPRHEETVPYVRKVISKAGQISKRGLAEYVRSAVTWKIMKEAEAEATAFLEEGRYHKALYHWRNIADLAEGSKVAHARALLNVGECYAALGKDELAREMFEQVRKYGIKPYYKASMDWLSRLES